MASQGPLALDGWPCSVATMTQRILILGGTGEARRLAARLAERQNLEVTLSLAGRTASPLAQPVPTRVGGFGGVEGLADHLQREAVAVLIDATHPYAERMSESDMKAVASFVAHAAGAAK